MHVIDYFRQAGLQLSTALEADLKAAWRLQSLKKGSHFHSFGLPCTKIAFISEGKAHHYYPIDGKEITRWVSLEHTFLTSFESFVQQIPSLDAIQCIEDCTLYTASREAFMAIRDKHREMELLWSRMLERELSKYHYRIYQHLTTDAEKRYLDFLQKYPRIAREVPQKFLASMMGIEPRHLSRIRKKLSQGN